MRENLDNVNFCFALFEQDSGDFWVGVQTANAEYGVFHWENAWNMFW